MTKLKLTEDGFLPKVSLLQIEGVKLSKSKSKEEVMSGKLRVITVPYRSNNEYGAMIFLQSMLDCVFYPNSTIYDNPHKHFSGNIFANLLQSDSLESLAEALSLNHLLVKIHSMSQDSVNWIINFETDKKLKNYEDDMKRLCIRDARPLNRKEHRKLSEILESESDTLVLDSRL